jgi:hypothetical protein
LTLAVTGASALTACQQLTRIQAFIQATADSIREKAPN